MSSTLYCPFSPIFKLSTNVSRIAVVEVSVFCCSERIVLLVVILGESILLITFAASCFELQETKMARKNSVKNFIVKCPVKLQLKARTCRSCGIIILSARTNAHHLHRRLDCLPVGRFSTNDVHCYRRLIQQHLKKKLPAAVPAAVAMLHQLKNTNRAVVLSNNRCLNIPE